MPRAVSVFSSELITSDSLSPLMRRLQATPENKGWLLERNQRTVYIEVNSQDISTLAKETIEGAAELLDAPVKSSVVFVFTDLGMDDVEFRMTQATIKAMSEMWPIVYDDHATVRKRVWPPQRSTSLDNS